MKLLRYLVLIAFVSPVLCFGASKEIVELQRDVALLQDQVRTLQRSLDEKTAAIQVLLQQTLDSVNKGSTSVAVMQNTMGDRMREQEKTLAVPVANIGAKVDSMTSDVQALKDSLADLNGRMGKLQQMMVDLKNVITVMQQPPQPPPATGPGGPTGAATPPPGLSAEALYNGAMKDQMSGKYDLALKEFNDYLTYFGTTEMAPNAQYHIGEIYNRQNDLDNAAKAFDAVLEKYPDNNKTPDAILMKGLILVRMNQRNDGAKQFRDLIKRFPNTEQAGKARAELKKLGLSTSSSTAKKHK